jgi:hypothetical protein
MSVGSPFPCPLSFHGQWPSSCEFVTTKAFDVPSPSVVSGLMYCPNDHPYPYEVAIGFDPLWSDFDNGGDVTRTNGVSSTKYHSDGSFPQSYSGLDPSDGSQRGYAWFRMSNESPTDNTDQQEFLCSDRAAGSTLP